MVGVVPFTMAVLAPTNSVLHAKANAKQLSDSAAEKQLVDGLVKKWGSLNAIRALLPTAAAILVATTVFG